MGGARLSGVHNGRQVLDRALEQILRWCIRVEHRFSGAFESSSEFGFSRWGNRALTSAAKAWPFLQPCYARLKACSTHHWIQKLWNCSETRGNAVSIFGQNICICGRSTIQ